MRVKSFPLKARPRTDHRLTKLGIIQDSVKDWWLEGSRMSQMYENAHVTLSATKSNDAHEGYSLLSNAVMCHKQ
jgi:hypothetical protein